MQLYISIGLFVLNKLRWEIAALLAAILVDHRYGTILASPVFAVALALLSRHAVSARALYYIWSERERC
jgi:hypothetical protein